MLFETGTRTIHERRYYSSQTFLLQSISSAFDRSLKMDDKVLNRLFEAHDTFSVMLGYEYGVDYVFDKHLLATFVGDYVDIPVPKFAGKKAVRAVMMRRRVVSIRDGMVRTRGRNEYNDSISDLIAYQSHKVNRATTHARAHKGEEKRGDLVKNWAGTQWLMIQQELTDRFLKLGWSYSIDDTGRVVLDTKALTGSLTGRIVCPGPDLQTVPKKETGMLYIALLLGNNTNYNDIAKTINDDTLGTWPVMADTSLDALKERIRNDIRSFPDHRWLILSGGTIGEASSPPVVFRQW